MAKQIRFVTRQRPTTLLEAIKPERDIAFLVPYLLSESVQKVFGNAQEGGHHPRIHQSVLMELRVPISLVEVRDDLSRQVRQFIKAIRQGEEIFGKCLEQVSGILNGS